MAAGYSKKPSPPSHKRRYPLDFYEFVFFIIFSMFFSLTLGLISGLWVFGDIDPNKEIVGIATMTWSLGGLLLCSAVLVMFDRAAVSRQKQKFDFDLKEYEMLRMKWLELEAESMENNALRNNNTFYIAKEVPDETPVQETEVLTSTTDEE
tara:strand:- start:296 stop:748 length:453 start_codon:yes stop_codon:yes gene_type:complete